MSPTSMIEKAATGLSGLTQVRVQAQNYLFTLRAGFSYKHKQKQNKTDGRTHTILKRDFILAIIL